MKKVSKALKKVSVGAKLLGGDEKEKKAAPVAEATPAPAAQVVEAPKEDSTETDENTESAKKAARARGKRGLSVARSAGTGINI